MYDYDTACSRNIGWVTAAEQARLHDARVAIAGLGGVGGSHLLTHARLGLGGFHIADLDTFDLVNMNRQAGAFQSTVNEAKVDVLARMAADINPDADIVRFDRGVTQDNLDAFLADVDIYIDGLDFFEIAVRRAVFARCHALGIPAVTAAPLGMSAALLVFLPGRMRFDEYFGLNDAQSADEQYARFFVGLAPAGLQRHALVDPTTLSIRERRGPSTAIACEFCAGLAATETLKILLGRGPVRAAPRGLQFDAYTQKLVRTWRPGGNANPVNRWILSRVRKAYMGGAANGGARTDA